MSDEEEHIELYGDDRIASKDAKVALWLKIAYVLVSLWALLSLVLYWNGSAGWLDRGYWSQLQKAANTTYPFQNLDNPSDQK
jgi:hypothetical protein